MSDIPQHCERCTKGFYVLRSARNLGRAEIEMIEKAWSDVHEGNPPKLLMLDNGFDIEGAVDVESVEISGIHFDLCRDCHREWLALAPSIANRFMRGENFEAPEPKKSEVRIVACTHCGRPVQATIPGLPVTCNQCMSAIIEARRLPGARCPHGHPVTECQSCYVESDIAYDAERERR